MIAPEVGPIRSSSAWNANQRARRRVFDRPTTAARGRRGLLLSLVLHAAVIGPLVTVTVLARAYEHRAPDVVMETAVVGEPEPMEEYEAPTSSFETLDRTEDEEPSEAVEIPVPEFEETAFEGPAAVPDDPLRDKDLGQKIGPNGTRAAAAATAGDGDDGGAGESDGDGAPGQGAAVSVGTPEPRRAAVLTRPVRLSAPWNPERDYPERARDRGLQGHVAVEFLIGIDGKIKDARVIEEESDADAMLIDKALQIIRRQTWVPAKRDGRPFECWYRTPRDKPIRFVLED